MYNSNFKIFIYLLTNIINISFINSQCTTDTIKQSSECLNNKLTNSYCCAITNIKTNNTYCTEISKVNYQGQSYINLTEQQYYLDCGAESTNNLPPSDQMTRCGPYIAFNETECWKYSNEKNSCCYFKEEEEQGCSWAGMKYKGKSVVSTGNTTISCMGEVLSIQLVMYITAIFIFLA